MPIESITTYLVHPRAPGDDAREIRGISVPLRGDLYDTFNAVYEKSDDECDIEIAFNSSGAVQQNDFRDLVISYIQERNIENGRFIANRLREHTTGRSKLGLLVLMFGREGNDHKLVISRYPTKNGISAEEVGGRLDVQFLERVFMKSALAYKAALFRNASLHELWDGRAVDKQISNRSAPSPEYWIHQFLGSDFKTTSALGTRRLAVALKKAIGSANSLEIKQELVAAATLARGLAGGLTSVDALANQFNLSQAAQDAVRSYLPNLSVAAQQFTLDVSVFDEEVAYRAVQLDNGVTLTAEASDFDALIERRNTKDGGEEFITRGHVVDEKLRRGGAA